MFDFMTIVRALADENRVRILMALRGRELCVCQVTGLLDLAPSSTSRHLSILRQAKLITCRKKGKWVYYSLPTIAEEGKEFKTQAQNAASLAVLAANWVQNSLCQIPEILADEKRIQEILKREQECFNLANLDEDQEQSFHSPEIHTLADDLLDVDLPDGDLPDGDMSDVKGE